MAKENEKEYINTTIKKSLLRSMKILAAQEGVRLNYLLEEAMQDLLTKYEKKLKGSSKRET
jgi:hypothetical protein